MRRNTITYFDHGNEQAQNTAKAQLEIILANIKHLGKVRNGYNLISKAREFNNLIQQNIKLSPKQLSFVDGIYEKMMKGAGYDSCTLHIDKKRKGLRF